MNGRAGSSDRRPPLEGGAAGPGTGPDGVPAAIALTPILSARPRAEDLERVQAAAPGSRVVLVASDGTGAGRLDDVEVLLRGSLPAETFDRLIGRCPRLRWVHSASAGVERVLTPLARERGLVITNARGVFSRPIAEYVMLMMLAVSRRLPQLIELQRERTWQPLQGVELRDVTVGIVGFGSIGRTIAVLAAPFGPRILALRRDPRLGIGSSAWTGPEPIDETAIRVERILGPEELPDLMAASDFVVLTLPMTAGTIDLFDEAMLRHARPGSWLINVSRGRLVDERALARALRDGPLGGAVLDTFREEPLSPTSPLYDLPNVILTPHTSWSSGRVLDESVGLFCENLGRFRAGAPLLNVVDPDAGY